MLKMSSIILACALAAFQATAAHAQAYPTRDVTFIVPWNAGPGDLHAWATPPRAPG